MEITEFGAAELLRRMSDRQFSIREVVEAYIARLQALQPTHHLLTAERFELAVKEAEALEQTGPVGGSRSRLRGLPITVKDCFQVAGLPTSLGLDRDLAPASEDAFIVRVLRRQGAVVLAKTNVPQLMLTWDTQNPCFGRTPHPTRSDRSPGGSSGGEAAAVALGGSALGLGSDLVGSIRLPAHACGICGFKPTSLPVTTEGLYQAFPLWLPIPTSVGPLARCVEDLRLWWDVVTQETQTSQFVPREQSRQRRLRCAFWLDDPYFPTLPGVREIVELVRESLAAQGAEIIEFPVPDTRELIRLGFLILFSDRLECVLQDVPEGSLQLSNRRMLRLLRLHRIVRNIICRVERWRGDQHRADLLWALRRPTLRELLYAMSQLEEQRQRFLNDWSSAQIDVIIMPAFPCPAYRPGDEEHLAAACGFLFLANIWDLPAGVLPGGTFPKEHSHGSMACSQRFVHPVELARLQRICQDADGLPVGIQVLGRPNDEGRVLAVMGLIERLNFKVSAQSPVRAQ